MNQLKRDRKQPGQGIVEYTGALVIAAILVATAMSGGVSGLSGIFSTIITAAQSMLQGFIPS